MRKGTGIDDFRQRGAVAGVLKSKLNRAMQRRAVDIAAEPAHQLAGPEQV